MSEQSNVEAVRAVYERWGQGDFSSGLEPYGTDPEIVLGPEFPDAGKHQGVEGISAYTRGFLAPWERITIEAEDVRDFGDRVLVSVVQRGTGSGSGIEIEMRYFHLWTFEGSSAKRLESIKKEADAVAAAEGSQE